MTAETRGPGHRLTERYTLVRVLGRGGMATVWEAVNEKRQRVAIKLLHPELATKQDNVSRFFLEARNATRIAHPGIVRVLDTGQTDDGAPFLVMERLEGLSLEQFLERHGPLTAAQAVSVLAPMLDALAAAHAAGVIHRDLKPGNVFIALGATPSVKLLDFGISRAVSHETRLTQTGMMFGTPAYMAPEQIQGIKDAGASVDLYSTGAIAFELVSGKLPHTAPSALALAALVVSSAAPRLASVAPGAPAAFAAVVDQALQRDPAQRHPDAASFKRALVNAVTPDLQWLFERAAELTSATRDAPADAVRLPRGPPAATGPEVTLAVLLERLAATDRQLPPAIAVRLVYDLLLDAGSPPVFGPSHVRIAANGVVRAVAGVPKRLRFATSVQTTTAPEAWAANPGALSSQFSAGAVLVQLLTGKAAFEASDEAALEQRVRAGVSDGLLAELPAPIRATVQRMLSADPLRRFADAGTCATELAAPYLAAPLFSRAREELAALLRFTASAPATPKPGAVPAPSPPARERSVTGLVVLLGVLAIGVVAFKLRGPSMLLVEQEDGGFALLTPEAFDASLNVREPQLVTEYAIQTTPPGAALWLDGQFHGNTPGKLKLEGTVSGKLHLELPAHEPLDVAVAPDGQPHSLILRLAPVKGVTLAWAWFELADDEALWLDDVLVARGVVRLPVEAGVGHRWDIERAGTRATQKSFTLERGKEAKLEPKR